MSPIANTSGCPGQRAIGEHRDPPRPVDLRAGRLPQHPGEGGRFDTRGPDLGVTADPPFLVPLLDDHSGLVDVGDDARHLELDAEFLEPLGRLAGKLVAECRKDLLAAIADDDSGVARVDFPEVVLEHAPRQLGDLARDLHSGRTAADHHEGQPFLLLLGILLELGHLERPEDPAPELEGVVDRLHPGSPARELVVAEVGLPGTAGDDQAVVRELELPPVGPHRRHVPSLQVEAADLGQLDLDVPVAVQDPAQRRRDLPLREDPRRDLVEQRLEEVVVDPVHQGDLNGRPAQVSGREQAAEASAHDHHSMGIRRHGLPVEPVPPTRRDAPAGGRRRGSRWPSPSAPG